MPINKENDLLENSFEPFVSNDILNSDKTINPKSLKSDVIKYKEEFYLDYNTKKLKYRLFITYETDQIGIEIEVN